MIVRVDDEPDRQRRNLADFVKEFLALDGIQSGINDEYAVLSNQECRIRAVVVVAYIRV